MNVILILLFYITGVWNKNTNESLSFKSYSISCINLSVGEGQFLDSGFGTEVDFLQIQPKQIRSHDRFKIIYFILLIGYRTPAGGRYMRFVRCGNSERDRYITHHTEYTGYSYFSVRSLRDCMYIKEARTKRSLERFVPGSICNPPTSFQ